MPNNNIFSGADVTVSVAVESGLEGDKAKGIVDAYHLAPIGRAKRVELHACSDVKPFNEMGQRYPTELRAGNIALTGTIERAYINGALLKLLLGDAAEARPAGSFVQPSFALTLLMENPAFPGKRSVLTLHGVKFQDWSLIVPEDNFVMEKVGFQALYVTVEDKEG
jgi:hypothetical protein